MDADTYCQVYFVTMFKQLRAIIADALCAHYHCMVNVNTKLIADSDGAIQGVRNFKTAVCGRKYVAVILKLLPPKQYLRQNPTPSVIPCRVRAPCMEVGSIKVEVGSSKLHIAPVHRVGIAALLLFRASLHTSFFMLPTSFGDSPTVVRE